MDYEKPEAVNPQPFYPSGHSGQSPLPDGETTLHNFDEVTTAGDRREFRGESLWYGPCVKVPFVTELACH
jgi:hypothetical protein